MERLYRAELQKIRKVVEADGRPLAIAFVPVDLRLQETALSGALILLDYLTPKLLVPMHLNGGTDLPDALAEALEQDPDRGGATRVVPLVHSGQAADAEGQVED